MIEKSKNWVADQSVFQCIEGRLACLVPGKLDVHFRKIIQWPSDACEVLNEPSVVATDTLEALHLFAVCWSLRILDSADVVWIGTDGLAVNYVAKILIAI